MSFETLNEILVRIPEECLARALTLRGFQPGIPEERISSRGFERIPSRNSERIPSRDSEKIPSRDSESISDQDSDKIPNRDFERIPGRDSKRNSGRDSYRFISRDSRRILRLPLAGLLRESLAGILWESLAGILKEPVGIPSEYIVGILKESQAGENESTSWIVQGLKRYKFLYGQHSSKTVVDHISSYALAPLLWIFIRSLLPDKPPSRHHCPGFPVPEVVGLARPTTNR